MRFHQTWRYAVIRKRHACILYMVCRMRMLWKPQDCTNSASREYVCQTKKCSSDHIGACVKRDPSSPACMIQDVTGVYERDMARAEDRPDRSTREVSFTVNVPYWTSWRVMKNYTLTMQIKCKLCYLQITHHLSNFHFGFYNS